MHWYSNTYNRPLKDPVLLSYTLEELYYEYCLRTEYPIAEEERTKEINDKIEGDEAERKYLESQAAMKEFMAMQEMFQSSQTPQAPESKEPDTQSQVPKEDVAWMERVLEDAKQTYGESFGEDLEI
jgi:hypothetical protein